MTNTPFSKKCEILADYVLDYGYENKDFIEQHDIGFPLAMLVVQGCATPTIAGIGFVEATYDNLCDYLGVSKDIGWDTVEDMIA